MATSGKDLVGVIFGLTKVVKAGHAAVCSSVQQCLLNSSTYTTDLFPDLATSFGSEWTIQDIPAKSHGFSDRSLYVSGSKLSTVNSCRFIHTLSGRRFFSTAVFGDTKQRSFIAVAPPFSSSLFFSSPSSFSSFSSSSFFFSPSSNDHSEIHQVW